ncbi:hypothetical protein D3C78_1577340 [compost metagenome]
MRQQVADHWPAIRKGIAQIPEEDTLRGLLRTTGGSLSPDELGVERELLQRSLREAHLVRPERFTLLHARNEAGTQF